LHYIRLVGFSVAPVLMVDDNEDLRDAVAFMLVHNGWKVACASDGQEALALLRGGLRPCLILLDLYMPAMDGFAFRAEQMADPEVASIPTIVLSGAYDAQRAGVVMSAAATFVKPCDPEALLSAIERLHRHD
jgi:CheY-like chemotaxis protein